MNNRQSPRATYLIAGAKALLQQFLFKNKQTGINGQQWMQIDRKKSVWISVA